MYREQELNVFKIEYFKKTGNGQIRFGWTEFLEPDEPPVAVINGRSSAQVGQTVNFNAIADSNGRTSPRTD